MKRGVLLTIAMLSAGVPVASQTAGPPFELAASRDRFLGGTRGTLVIDDGGVAFRAPAAKDTRAWKYDELRQVRVLSPTELELATYEDQGRLRFGADRIYEFDVAGGISPDLVGYLLTRIDRPVVTAVMPLFDSPASFEAPAKWARHGRGSDGTLRLYDAGFAYVTDRRGDSRFWRFRDIFAALKIDAFRLEILAYEGGSGETRPFTFELKRTLPPGMFDALWQRVNRPAVRPNRVESRVPEEVSSMKAFPTLASALVLGLATAQVPVVAAPAQASPAPIEIGFATKPDPPQCGDNALEVTLQNESGPITDAAVTVTFYMPPMPSMNMPAMKNTAKLAHAGKGVYRGTGEVMMSGDWEVTISASRNGKEIGSRKVKITAQ